METWNTKFHWNPFSAFLNENLNEWMDGQTWHPNYAFIFCTLCKEHWNIYKKYQDRDVIRGMNH